MQPQSRANNFDLLRFWAATAVIISHAYAFYGKSEPLHQFPYLDESLGGMATSLFFVISGFLITMSYERSTSLRSYFFKRALRIFPALIVCILLLTYGWGAFMSHLPLTDYLTNPLTHAYMFNAALIVPFRFLPGVTYPTGDLLLVNGSLWTLPVEFFMYMAVAVLGVCGLLTRKTLPFLVLIGFALLIRLPIADDASVLNGAISVKHAMKHMLYFGMGMLFYLYRDSIPLNRYVFFFMLALTVITISSGYIRAVIFITYPYMILYISHLKHKTLNNFAKYGNFSYGLYIYAFPIQQSYMLFFRHDLSIGLYILLSFITTLVFAILSWYCIEKPALALKRYS